MVRKCVVSLAAGSVLVKRAMPKRKPSTTTLTEIHISNLPSELALGTFFEWVHERTGCNQLRIKQEGRKTYAFAAVDLENKTEAHFTCDELFLPGLILDTGASRQKKTTQRPRKSNILLNLVVVHVVRENPFTIQEKSLRS